MAIRGDRTDYIWAIEGSKKGSSIAFCKVTAPYNLVLAEFKVMFVLIEKDLLAISKCLSTRGILILQFHKFLIQEVNVLPRRVCDFVKGERGLDGRGSTV